MRLNCLHGFFIIDELAVGQASDFMSRTGLKLAPWRGAYTFEALKAAPSYSLAGKDLLGFKAIETFEGEPWEVFEANGVVYDFAKGQLVPILSVSTKAKVSPAGNRFHSEGLIQPGSIIQSGQRVKSYETWYLRNRSILSWLYSGVSYV